MNKSNLYLSFDIESDGNNAICNNMILIEIDKLENEVFTFYRNICHNISLMRYLIQLI